MKPEHYFKNRLNMVLYYRLSANQTRLEMLRLLFPNGEQEMPQLTSESHQGWTLAGLANSYSQTGNTRRALQLTRKAFSVAERFEEAENILIGLENMAHFQIILGELKSAESKLARAIETAHKSHDELSEGAQHIEMGLLFAYMGRFDASNAEYDIGQAIIDKVKDSNFRSIVRLNRALTSLFMRDSLNALRY